MADDLQAAPGDSAPESTPAAEPKPAKKAATRKAAAKKTTAKKTTAKKATATKAAEEQLELGSDSGAGTSADAGADSGEPAAGAPAKKTAARKTAAKKTTAKKAPAKKAPAKKATAKAAAAEEKPAEGAVEAPHGDPTAPTAPAVLFQAPEPTAPARRRTRKTAEAAETAETAAAGEPGEQAAPEKAAKKTTAKKAAATKATTKKATAKKTAAKKAAAPEGEQPAEEAEEQPAEPQVPEQEGAEQPGEGETGEGAGSGRRRRRRGGRRRRKSGDSESAEAQQGEEAGEEEQGEAASGSEEAGGEGGTSRRRRRRRRSGDDGGESSDDPENTVTRVRSRRSAEDEITAVSGSTRLEAKKQRRREGREAGRRRAPIVSESEFLARRESVDRVMVIRQREDLTQIGVLEDRVLVEHYVARESQTSLIGNVYLGRVQNVLPSMEAAFIDIGKGRNAVLYAGEVNWSALGHKDGQPRKIESVLSSGQTVLVQVTKDPIGHKGARLTSQISLAGRFLVYVPDGTTSGISRKLPDTERNRLKTLLKEIVPDTAGVIVRTAAEGASEEELTRDVERLKARWEDIEGKAKGSAPQLLYGEPDLTLKVVRDLFTEDFSKLVIQGDDAWDTVQGYVAHVAPDLEERLVRYDPGADGQHGKADVFAEYRIDEQISKGLDRKVWLPSGGSLIIDRTEAMTVVDVNTGKFTGSGGNLEETVTKNNLEAAEEIVRQLRLRDIGGIIVVDFIDMVLESNRDLVLRRLVECLGRDRTRHQVAEVTSLGLVQMTRKRIGTGLLEAFSENCEHCQGRGLVIHDHPVEAKRGDDDSKRSGRRGRRGRGGENGDQGGGSGGQKDAGRDRQKGEGQKSAPSPKDVAAMARAEHPEESQAPETEPQAPETEPQAPETEPQAPKVTSRSRRRSASRPAGEPAVVEPVGPPLEPVEPVEAVETPAAGRDAAAEQPAEAAEAVEPAEPAAPKVTTRSRRRSASRPAGEPTTAEPVEPVEPVETPAVERDAAAEQPAEPAAPKVVTRTRRRSASRPAGPPAAEPGAGAPVEEADAGTGSADADPELDEHGHVEHVPIKKKGARKR